MELHIAESSTGSGEVVLTVSGSVDLSSQSALLTRGQDVVGREGVTGVVLDLSEVSFLDSTGLGALVELSRDAEDHDLDFAISNPSMRVQRVLEVTGLRDRWRIFTGD